MIPLILFFFQEIILILTVVNLALFFFCPKKLTTIQKIFENVCIYIYVKVTKLEISYPILFVSILPDFQTSRTFSLNSTELNECTFFTHLAFVSKRAHGGNAAVCIVLVSLRVF